jgi:hypothetical protein
VRAALAPRGAACATAVGRLDSRARLRDHFSAAAGLPQILKIRSPLGCLCELLLPIACVRGSCARRVRGAPPLAAAVPPPLLRRRSLFFFAAGLCC